MADFKKLQQLVRKIRQERGFVTDPLKIFILLTEEIGEIGAELKRLWSPNYKKFCKDDLKDELADALVCLMALANQFDIDLEQALKDKLINKDSKREWRSAERGKNND